MSAPFKISSQSHVDPAASASHTEAAGRFDNLPAAPRGGGRGGGFRGGNGGGGERRGGGRGGGFTLAQYQQQHGEQQQWAPRAHHGEAPAADGFAPAGGFDGEQGGFRGGRGGPRRGRGGDGADDGYQPRGGFRGGRGNGEGSEFRGGFRGGRGGGEGLEHRGGGFRGGRGGGESGEYRGGRGGGFGRGGRAGGAGVEAPLPAPAHDVGSEGTAAPAARKFEERQPPQQRREQQQHDGEEATAEFGGDGEGPARRGGRGGVRGGRGGRGRGGADGEAGAANEGDEPFISRRRAPEGGYDARLGAPRIRPSRERRSAAEEAEVEALFTVRHKQEGISFERYEAIHVELVPRDVAPCDTFAKLQLHDSLLANVTKAGYTAPTPVQKYGVPVAIAGKDLMACAQTGSGKTAAFLIPIINHVLVHGVSLSKTRRALPIGIVMAPTRELALQIYDEARKMCFQTDVYTAVIYGGADGASQAAQLADGADIIVATPGRLKDMFERNRVGFQRSRYLVLDEADRMLDLGFEDQIDFIVSNMPSTDERQTFLYSATFPKPIQNLARRYLKRDHYLLTVGRVGSTTKNITQRVLHVQERDKRDRLLRLILTQSPNDLVLVFVETKNEANGLWDFLSDEGIPTEAIHGNRTQPEREAALFNFKSGQCPILVATDVASRGLDIPNVSHVIQYDLPKTLDDYTHRIGRTGRAGNQGTATSFFNKNAGHIAAELVEYLKEHDQEVPEYLEDAAAEALAAGARRAMGGAGGRQTRRQGESWADARGAGGDSGVAPPQQRRAKEVSSVAKRMEDGGF